jgi:hypothetical protein
VVDQGAAQNLYSVACRPSLLDLRAQLLIRLHMWISVDVVDLDPTAGRLMVVISSSHEMSPQTVLLHGAQTVNSTVRIIVLRKLSLSVTSLFSFGRVSTDEFHGSGSECQRSSFIGKQFVGHTCTRL